MAPVERIVEGPWAGWTRWTGTVPNRFSELLGAHYFRRNDVGAVECATETGERHLNGLGYLHGGYLMAFIDQVLFAIARPALSPQTGAVTLTCDTQFLGPGVAHKVLLGTGEILQETGKMLFIRGLLTQESKPVCAFTGTLRKVTRSS